MADQENPSEDNSSTDLQQLPGNVVSPGSEPQTTPKDEAPEATQQDDNAQPDDQQPESSLYNPEDTDEKVSQTGDNQTEASEISWIAPEFVSHEKSPVWYFYLLIATVIFSILLYLLTKDFITVGVVIVAAIVLAVYASHKPNMIEYRLSEQDIEIGKRHLNYGDFKYFSVTKEGSFHSAILMPLKRFAPTASVYFDQSNEDKVLNLLTKHLPYEEHKPDMVDIIMSRIRF